MLRSKDSNTNKRANKTKQTHSPNRTETTIKTLIQNKDKLEQGKPTTWAGTPKAKQGENKREITFQQFVA